MSNAERLLRLDSHKIHTVFLLANAWIRNKWINDQLLHVRREIVLLHYDLIKHFITGSPHVPYPSLTPKLLHDDFKEAAA